MEVRPRLGFLIRANEVSSRAVQIGNSLKHSDFQNELNRLSSSKNKAATKTISACGDERLMNHEQTFLNVYSYCSYFGEF